MRRVYLALELLVLFGGIPVVLIYTEDTVPIIPTILLIAGVVLVALRRSGWKYAELWRLGPARSWRNMLLLWLVFVGVWTVVAHEYFPEQFLTFPREQTEIWLLVLLLYPLLSALPQEFLYRTFLFERYRTLFDHAGVGFALVSGLAFMWGHVLFMNWVTFAITFAAGVVFAWRYWYSRSLILVTVEHALYGNLFFTLGLGSQFLYSGMV